MKRVYVAKNPADAHLLKGLLEGERIEALVRGEFLWGARGEVPLTPETSPSVWVVNEVDYDRALEMVEEFRLNEGGRPREGTEWTCGRCGEINEAPFTECWQCGTERPLGKGDP